jgi:4-hydroxy-3-polyprenylbenzoate decarboxylase
MSADAPVQRPARAPASVTLGLTGASGMAYGLRLLECLLGAGVRVAVVYSQAAQVVAKQELDVVLPGRAQDARTALLERYRAAPELLWVYGRDDWYAPMASGSNTADAMVVCPCSMGALAAIAGGLADNLIERAADVMLKEGRTLILVPRETPCSLIHLENMTRAARAGAVILPANPGFYHRPQRVEDLVDFVVARILDRLGVPNEISARWGREPHA